MKQSKNKYISISFLCITLQICYSQWEPQNSSVSTLLRDVQFVNKDTGWVVGDKGVVLKTSNGGAVWEKDSSFSNDIEFKKVLCVSPDLIFICGNKRIPMFGYVLYQNIIFKTTDNGIQWKTSSTIEDSGYAFENIQFISSDTGWLSLNNNGAKSFEERKGLMLKTVDGGETWNILNVKNFDLLVSFIFRDASNGFSFWSDAIDNFSYTQVEYSNDGGISWTSMGGIVQDLVQKAHCSDDNNLWAIGSKSSISVDSGKTWSSLNWFNPTEPGEKKFGINDFEIITPDTMLFVGTAYSSPSDNEGRILQSIDGGKNWKISYQLPSGVFRAISTPDGNEGWLVGGDGLILHNNNMVTQIKREMTTNPKFFIHQNYPNPFNPSTMINYSLPERSAVRITIINTLGQTISEIVNETKDAGSYEQTFNSSNLSSGMYFYRIEATSTQNVGHTFVETKKMLLLR